MPDSLLASDTALLRTLSLVCYSLAAGSLLVWLGCFYVRIRRLQTYAREKAAEEKLTGLVIDDLAGYPVPADAYSSLPDWQRELLMGVIKGVLSQIKGADHAKLITMMQREGFMATALRALKSARSGTRHSACRLLGYFDDPAAITALRGALNDRDLAVRLSAAHALLRKDKVDHLPELLAKLKFSPDDPSLILAELFSRLPESLRPQAIRMLQGSIPDEWKRMLAIALGRNQVVAAFPALYELSHHPAERVRASAWVGLHAMGDPRTAEFLLDGLRDPSATVRQAACRCAGAFGGEPVQAQLLRLLDDADWWVRFAAASALYELGGECQRQLEQHSQAAPDDDVGLLVLREREMEAQYGS